MIQIVNIPDVLFFQEGPGVRKSQFTNAGVKLLNVGNINNNKIDLSTTEKYISKDEAYGKYSHFLVDNGDLLIACSGIVVNNFHNKISFITEKDLPLCLNTSTMRFKSLDKNKLHINFFYYFLKTISFKKQIGQLITGSAQLNFGPSHIRKIKMPLPSLEKQKQIAKTLDKAQELITLRKESISKLDELSKSIFIDMFGDPFKNKNNCKLKTIKEIGKVQTGNTPPRIVEDNYGDFIEWIKSDNIIKDKFYLNTSKEYLSKKGLSKGRLAVKGSLLFTCIAGSMSSIGNVGIVNRDVTFNQQINSVTPYEDNFYYLYFLFKILKKYFEENSTKSMKIMINKSTFEKIEVPIAPLDQQNKFAKIIEKIEEQKALYEEELKKLQYNFDALLQKSFQG